MRRQGLKTRLARLERRHAPRRKIRIFAHIRERSEIDIIGYSSLQYLVEIERRWGEPLADFQERALASLQGVFIVAIYSPPQEPAEREKEPSRYPTPLKSVQTLPGASYPHPST